MHIKLIYKNYDDLIINSYPSHNSNSKCQWAEGIGILSIYVLLPPPLSSSVFSLFRLLCICLLHWVEKPEKRKFGQCPPISATTREPWAHPYLISRPHSSLCSALRLQCLLLMVSGMIPFWTVMESPALAGPVLLSSLLILPCRFRRSYRVRDSG